MARILALPMLGAFGQGGAVCPPAYLPLITTMCVCSSLLMLLLPALAAQAGPVAACLRSAGWAATCVCEPCSTCAAHLLQATLSALARLARLARDAAVGADARLGN